mmetsp:Transcript_118717/g.335815  ORF Transcript_118717/g.335815 Transcript_118717/m.335815 type:complete len:272 (+) Transcript_118717:299-1114(+)
MASGSGAHMPATEPPWAPRGRQARDKWRTRRRHQFRPARRRQPQRKGPRPRSMPQLSKARGPHRAPSPEGVPDLKAVAVKVHAVAPPLCQDPRLTAGLSAAGRPDTRGRRWELSEPPRLLRHQYPRGRRGVLAHACAEALRVIALEGPTVLALPPDTAAETQYTAMKVSHSHRFSRRRAARPVARCASSPASALEGSRKARANCNHGYRMALAGGRSAKCGLHNRPRPLAKRTTRRRNTPSHRFPSSSCGRRFLLPMAAAVLALTRPAKRG